MVLVLESIINDYGAPHTHQIFSTGSDLLKDAVPKLHKRENTPVIRSHVLATLNLVENDDSIDRF